jgi:hypothetical protein
VGIPAVLAEITRRAALEQAREVEAERLQQLARWQADDMAAGTDLGDDLAFGL